MFIIIAFNRWRTFVSTQRLSKPFEWPNIIVTIVIIAGDTDTSFLFFGFYVKGQIVNRLRQWIDTYVHVGVHANESFISRYGKQWVQAENIQQSNYPFNRSGLLKVSFSPIIRDDEFIPEHFVNAVFDFEFIFLQGIQVFIFIHWFFEIENKSGRT